MKAKIDAYSIFLHGALVALCGLTIVLALDNQRLKRQLQPLPNGPAVGQHAENFYWQPLDGAAVKLDLAAGERDSLLFIFTTECPSCRENQSDWRSVYQTLTGTVNMVGISLSELDATRAYRDAHSLPFPVGVPVDPAEFTASFAVSGVPLTVRIGPDGRVTGNWSGKLSKRQLSEIVKGGNG